MKTVGNIFLIWRKGKGGRRISVGVIKRNSSEGVRFHYLNNNLVEAKKMGFKHYEGFPDTEKVYSENVLDIFGQRIVRSERNDVNDFYDFWQIDKKYKEDDFYMLAYTQGLLPTDNFEFLADFNPVRGLSFITEIAGLSTYKLSKDTIKLHAKLTYKLESNNTYDSKAVMLFYGKKHLGYVKCIHNNVFHKTKKKFHLTVRRIEQNGLISRVFIKVSY